MNNIKYNQAFVSFVDILGFSEIVQKSNNSTLPKIKKLVDQFRNSFSEDAKGGIYEDSNVDFLAFSDCLMRVRNTDDSPVFYELLSYVHNVSETINKGHFVRGGITFGNHYYDHKTNTLISPAFNRAYFLESKEAIYPRVIIDPQILEDFKTRKEWYKHGHTYKQEYKSVKNLIRLDDDGYYFIDYLKAIENELDHPPYDYPVFVRKHKELVENGLKSKNISIKKKYIWLANYHNTVLSEWDDCEGSEWKGNEWEGWKKGLPISSKLLSL